MLTAIAVLIVLIVSIVIYISTTHQHPKEDEYFDADSGNAIEKYKPTRNFSPTLSLHKYCPFFN